MGSVILKRLEDAEADNDPIFGVIVGSTTNHCGQTDSITRPHEGDQSSVFKRIMRYTNYDPLDVGYIEMHVSGTDYLRRLPTILLQIGHSLNLAIFRGPGHKQEMQRR